MGRTLALAGGCLILAFPVIERFQLRHYLSRVGERDVQAVGEIWVFVLEHSKQLEDALAVLAHPELRVHHLVEAAHRVEQASEQALNHAALLFWRVDKFQVLELVGVGVFLVDEESVHFGLHFYDFARCFHFCFHYMSFYQFTTFSFISNAKLQVFTLISKCFSLVFTEFIKFRIGINYTYCKPLMALAYSVLMKMKAVRPWHSSIILQ